MANGRSQIADRKWQMANGIRTRAWCGVICHLTSVICHLSSVICHLSSALAGHKP